MASEGPSWADQWGSGGIGVMVDDGNSNAKKDVSNKEKSKANSRFNKAKLVAFIGVKWMKNLVHRKKKSSSSS